MSDQADVQIQPISWLCEVCNHTFSNKQGLVKHCKKFHPSYHADYTAEMIRNSKYECAVCGKKFRLWRDMINHIKQSHEDISLKFENYSFYSDSEFDEWKKEMQKKTTSLFVKKRGSNKCDDNIVCDNYFCHRSGMGKLKAERKRRMKSGGSVKSGKTCPSFIKVVREQHEEAIEITVEYQSVHFGHELLIGKLPLPTEDRKKLAALLKIGIPPSKILQDIQSQFCATERIGYTTKKDLHNICHDFKIDKEIMFHKEDAVSVVYEKPNEQASFTDKVHTVQNHIQAVQNHIQVMQNHIQVTQNHLLTMHNQFVNAKNDEERSYLNNIMDSFVNSIHVSIPILSPNIVENFPVINILHV